MRILYILPSLSNTAPIQIASLLVESCIKNGFYVEVNYFDDICEIDFPCVSKRININKPIIFDDFDIIHSHMRRPDKYVAKYSKLIKKAKTISTIHCDIFEDLKYSYGEIVAYIFTKMWIKDLKKFNCIVQVSEFLMEKYKCEFNFNFLIHNGVKVVDGKNENYDSIIELINKYHEKGYKVILSYSNIIRRKGLSQIISVLPLRKQLVYICIGEGKELAALKKRVHLLGIEERVLFCGFIDKPYNLIPYVDLFIVSSYSESFCLALHEAAMKGAAIVCSKIDAFTDAYNNNEVTFFQPNDLGSLAKAIDRGLKRGKNTKLIEKEKNKYAVELMTEKYSQLYSKICKGEV